MLLIYNKRRVHTQYNTIAPFTTGMIFFPRPIYFFPYSYIDFDIVVLQSNQHFIYGPSGGSE